MTFKQATSAQEEVTAGTFSETLCANTDLDKIEEKVQAVISLGEGGGSGGDDTACFDQIDTMTFEQATSAKDQLALGTFTDPTCDNTDTDKIESHLLARIDATKEDDPPPPQDLPGCKSWCEAKVTVDGKSKSTVCSWQKNCGQCWFC